MSSDPPLLSLLIASNRIGSISDLSFLTAVLDGDRAEDRTKGRNLYFIRVCRKWISIM